MPNDPVCGTQVDEDGAVTAKYKGRTYFFDSDDCREEFLEAPEEYVADEVQLMSEEDY